MTGKQEVCPRNEVVLALRARRWSIGKHPKNPSRFFPERVENPESGLPFTISSAVYWLAEEIERGVELKRVILRKPPGAIAWEIVCPLPPNPQNIYVKFQFMGGDVVLRSFHLSDV